MDLAPAVHWPRTRSADDTGSAWCGRPIDSVTKTEELSRSAVLPVGWRWCDACVRAVRFETDTDPRNTLTTITR